MAWGTLLSLGLLAPRGAPPRPGGLLRLLCWQLSLLALFPGWQEAEYLVPPRPRNGDRAFRTLGAGLVAALWPHLGLRRVHLGTTVTLRTQPLSSPALPAAGVSPAWSISWLLIQCFTTSPYCPLHLSRRQRWFIWISSGLNIIHGL